MRQFILGWRRWRWRFSLVRRDPRICEAADGTCLIFELTFMWLLDRLRNVPFSRKGATGSLEEIGALWKRWRLEPEFTKSSMRCRWKNSRRSWIFLKTCSEAVRRRLGCCWVSLDFGRITWKPKRIYAPAKQSASMRSAEMYEIRLSRKAPRFYQKTDIPTARRLNVAFDRLAQDPFGQHGPNRRETTRLKSFRPTPTNVPRVVSRPVEAIVMYSFFLNILLFAVYVRKHNYSLV